MSNTIGELYVVMIKLLRENKFADVGVVNTRHLRSITEFNNDREFLDYVGTTYADELIIRKNGRKAFTECIYFHQFKGFKHNEKSITIYLNTGSNTLVKKNIRF